MKFREGGGGSHSYGHTLTTIVAFRATKKDKSSVNMRKTLGCDHNRKFGSDHTPCPKSPLTISSEATNGNRYRLAVAGAEHT